jgi:predicted dehydrogenase
MMASDNRTRRDFLATTTRSAVGAGLVLSAASWNSVLGANERIRLGVIGTGNRGGDVMSVFLGEPEVDVVALCDCYDVHLKAALEKTEGKAKTYTDYRALLDSKDVDAVLIATPDPWHSRMAIDAVHAGKDVYVEKPLTFTIEQGHEIIKVVRASDRVFQVGLQQRSGSHYWEAKREIVDKGKLGKVTLVRTWWHGNGYHLRKPNFTEQPPGLDWKAFLGPVKYRDFNAHQFYNWRAYLDFGGGQITDLFTHWIDVVHWFMNEDLPIAATAAGGVYYYKDGRTAPDTINLQLEYPSQWVATFEATLVPGARGAAIEFLGTEGRLQIDRGGYTYQEKAAGRRPPMPVASQGQAVGSNVLSNSVANSAVSPPAAAAQEQQARPTPAEPIVRRATTTLESEHVKSFLACVKSRKTPNSEVIGGHRSALASHLGKMAYLKKQRVTFDPSTEAKFV